MDEIARLLLRKPELASCENDIRNAANKLVSCFREGSKVLLCGNGGSCADCEHISGELVKSFSRPRPLPDELKAKLGQELASELHGGLPALSLPSMISFHTAFNNDDNPDFAFAQQVVAFGRPGDLLFCISTSGNSANVVHAANTAKAMNLEVISLTGESGGQLGTISDCSIKAPEIETARVQELHLPIYHSICQFIEETLFP